jgi:excisionase family DNA binding protein
MSDLVYTVPGAAAALEVSPTHVRNLIRRGEIPTVRIGRRVLISRAELSAWVAQRSVIAVDGRSPGFPRPGVGLPSIGVTGTTPESRNPTPDRRTSSSGPAARATAGPVTPTLTAAGPGSHPDPAA